MNQSKPKKEVWLFLGLVLLLAVVSVYALSCHNDVADLQGEVSGLQTQLAQAQDVRPSAAPAEADSEDVTVYVTASGTKYHRSGCQYLSQSKIEISLSKALKRGYTACSKCW